MLRGRDEFKVAVVVEIGDGVVPGLVALRLQQRGDLRIDQRELRVDIGQRGLLGLVSFCGLSGLGGLRGLGALLFGGRSGGAAGGEAQRHDEREKHCDESMILHFFFLLSSVVLRPARGGAEAAFLFQRMTLG